jgi:uncharacterized protein (TIGR03067 family)
VFHTISEDFAMKRVLVFAVIALTTISASAARADDKEAVKKDLEQFQGEWSMVSGSANGYGIPDSMRKDLKRVCKNDEITVTNGDQLFMKAKITIDPSKKPKTIDYDVIDGPTKGKKLLGIYELDGDKLKSCFAAPDMERPSDFTAKVGDKRTSSVWKREKGQ